MHLIRKSAQKTPKSIRGRQEKDPPGLPPPAKMKIHPTRKRHPTSDSIQRRRHHRPREPRRTQPRLTAEKTSCFQSCPRGEGGLKTPAKKIIGRRTSAGARNKKSRCGCKSDGGHRKQPTKNQTANRDRAISSGFVYPERCHPRHRPTKPLLIRLNDMAKLGFAKHISTSRSPTFIIRIGISGK